jgi:hypothetical protein
MAEPLVVVLGLDSMVMDNSETAKRHGVKPTYKKVKEFQPLQMTWGRFIVDTVFRGGQAFQGCGHGREHGQAHGEENSQTLTKALEWSGWPERPGCCEA